MADNGHIDLGNFTSREQNKGSTSYKRSSSGYSSRKRGVRHDRHKEREVSRGGVMLIKLGVCAGICALFALLKVINVPAINQGLNSIGTALNGGDQSYNEKNETLGKLKFVELPGILEVFAGGDSLTQPIKYSEARLDADKIMLSLSGEANSLVTVCGQGNVKSIGDDEKFGKYVIVSHENDVEITYYGFETISVEEGQPIKKLDTLGKLGEDGVLRLSITEKGAPENPCGYLGINAQDLAD